MSFFQSSTNSIRENITIFWRYLLTELVYLIEYPLNFFLSVCWGTIGLIPVYFFWKFVFNTTTVGSYSMTTMFFYYVFVTGLFYTGHWSNSIRRFIVTGDANSILTKNIPLANHMIYTIFVKIGLNRLVNLTVASIIGVIFLGIHSLLGGLFFILGLIIASMIYSVIISTSFWLGDNWGIFSIFSDIGMLLAGNIIPLDLFSHNIQFILNLLPFQLLFYIPAKIFIGQYTITYFTILLYLFWAIILYLILRVMIHRGLRRYEQMGG